MTKDKKTWYADTQADTFIEECFEQKCYEYKDHESIINQWRADKKLFSSITTLTGFDFQHYSMHDKSHSIAILRNIEMVLGHDRVEALEASDLWLLLEAAYCHDIGMSVSYKELCSIWESPKFEKFIKEKIYTEVWDDKKAVLIYKKMDQLLHNKTDFQAAAQSEDDSYETEEFREEFDDFVLKKSWPLIFERYILLLYTEYIRKKHPMRSKAFMIAYDKKEEKYIPHRMYEVVAWVAMLHGKDFGDIFKDVAQEENGFWAEHMHPRFAAAMLRLGDLLDMDSNRFNVRMVKHMGLIPLESMLHLKKHKSITHLNYSNGIIEAIARSDEFEVCKTTSQWFGWLDKEVKDLICCWNQIVPEQLQGCRLNRCKLEIYYKKEVFDASKSAKVVMDPERVYKMLIGDNIYKSRLDFIREYLQNALDASKMKIWLNLKDQDFNEHNLKDKGFTLETITPYDDFEKWFEQYRVEIKIHIEWKKKEIQIIFQDYGIGIEKECSKILSVVAGDSWKKRGYASEIPHMPLWLRPTGGFGIGIQSAFMITDKVEIITKAEKERIGRRICLEGRNKGGRVSEYAYKKAENGTRVCVSIKLTDFLNEALRNERMNTGSWKGNVYDTQDSCRIISQMVGDYVTRVAKYSLLPIVIKGDSEKEEIIKGAWLHTAEDGVKFLLGKSVSITVDGKQYDVRYAVTQKQTVVWDYTNHLMAVYMFQKKYGKINYYYKGMLVSNEECRSDGAYSVDIIYFGDEVSRYLTVNRENFIQDKKGSFLGDEAKYRDLYMKLLMADTDEFSKCFVTKSMVKSALVYYALGREEIDEGTYEKLLELAEDRIKIRCIDLNALRYYEELKHNIVAQITADPKGVTAAKRVLMGNALFVSKNMFFSQFIQDVRDNKAVFYRSEKESGFAHMDIDTLVRILLEQMEALEEDSADIPDEGSDERACLELLKTVRYFVDDEEICDILKKYTQERVQINIKENQEFVEGLVYAYKPEQTREIVVGLDREIQNYINAFQYELFERREYPIVLCSDDADKTSEKYRLWVKKVFSDTKIYSVDCHRIVNEKIELKESTKYFIMPFTKPILYNLREEIRRSQTIAREKYDQIVKNEDDFRLLIEWIYVNQTNEVKLKPSEIWEQYQLLLDWSYNTCFSQIKEDELRSREFSIS